LFSGTLLASGAHVALDDTIELPRAEWRYVDVQAKEPMAVMNCEYSVISENTEVRVVWIARVDLNGFRSGRRDHVLASTSLGREGRLRHFAPTAGDYAVIVEAEPGAQARAKVKIKVWMESAVSPKYLSRERRLAVIVISTIVFFGIASISAFKLRRA